MVFQPDEADLASLANVLSAEVDRLLLFFNSAIEPNLRARLEQLPNHILIEGSGNVGVGAALNGIAQAAEASGLDAIVFFDQDSKPTAGMIAQLLEAEATLLAAGESPAAVGPWMVAPPAGASKTPTYRRRSKSKHHGPLRAVEFLPTSGSLIRLAVLRRVGSFRADYFIDGVDLEWCFRAQAGGTFCWAAFDCPMVHTVGAGVIAWPWIGLRMPRQKPFRMYCAVRNTVYGLRLPHIPMSWKLRQACYLPVQILAYAFHHGFAPEILRMLGSGMADGIRGRLGVPPGLPESKPQPRRPSALGERPALSKH